MFLYEMAEIKQRKGNKVLKIIQILILIAFPLRLFQETPQNSISMPPRTAKAAQLHSPKEPKKASKLFIGSLQK